MRKGFAKLVKVNATHPRLFLNISRREVSGEMAEGSPFSRVYVRRHNAQ